MYYTIMIWSKRGLLCVIPLRLYVANNSRFIVLLHRSKQQTGQLAPGSSLYDNKSFFSIFCHFTCIKLNGGYMYAHNLVSFLDLASSDIH